VSLALYLTGFLAFVGIYLPQPILPLLAEQFGVKAASSSLLISLTVLGLGLASPVIGVLTERLGYRRTLVASSAALSLILLGCALGRSFELLLALRLLQGIMLPGLFVSALALTAEQLGNVAMTRAAGRYVAATVIGGLAGRLVGGVLAEFASWRYAFALASLCCAALVVIWLRAPANRAPAAPATLVQALRGSLAHLKNRAVLSGVSIGFCLFFAFQATLNYLPFKLRGPPFSLSPSLISLTYLAFVAGIISASLAGRLRARYPLALSLAAGFAIAIAGNLLTLSSSLALIAAGLLLVCFGNWLVQGLTVGLIATAAERERASANALYLFFYYLGGALGGYLPGLALPTWGYPAAVGVSVAALGFGILSTWRGLGGHRAMAAYDA
jgi:YNFM family putative membrane transporter